MVVASVLPGFFTAALAPRIRTDFAFSDSTLGLAIAIFYIASALASTPCGRLVDRIGASEGLRVAVVFTAACTLGIALFAGSAPVLVALLLLGALGNGFAGPGASALLTRHVDERRRGLAFGAQQAGAPIGALLAGLALPLVAIPLGWRWAFVAAALFAVAAGLAVPGAGRGAAVRRIRSPAAAVASPAPRSVYAIAVGAALASAAGMGMISFLVVFSVASGMSESAAGFVLGGVSFASAASRIGLGAAADRRNLEPLRLTMAMLAGGAAGFALLIPGEPALIVAGALVAGFAVWGWPGLLTLAVVQRTPGAPAAAVGIMLAGLFVGAVGGPLLVGALAERDAYTAAWLLCTAFALAAAAVVLAVRRLDAGRPQTSAKPT